MSSDPPCIDGNARFIKVQIKNIKDTFGTPKVLVSVNFSIDSYVTLAKKPQMRINKIIHV